QLYSRCSKNDDCSSINNLICSKENICACQQNYVEFNHHICRPLLGGRCANNESCVPRNSNCIDNKCECNHNYFSFTDNYCLPVRFAQCSDNKVCECNSNAGELNPAKCGSLLNGFCLSDNDCYHLNSICVNKRCQCKPKHYQCNNQKLYINISGYLNMTCSAKDVPCDLFIEHTKCSFDGKCVCQNRYLPINDTSCGLIFGAECFSEESCATVNAACIDNKCQCKLNYVYRYDKCLPGIPYAHCIDNSCQCKPQHAKLNETACAPVLGAFCWSDSPCADVNAVCIEHRCQCRAGFLAQSHDKCIKSFLGSSCERFGDCDVLHSKCSNKACECISSYIPLNKTTCAPLLGGFCWKSEKCLPDNSVCVDNECQCNKDYSRQSNERCLPTSLGQFCRVNADCIAIKYSVCSENTCVCKPNTVPAEGNRCKSLLGGVCGDEKDCFTRNGLCIGHSDDPVRCSNDGTCTCGPKHAALNDTICAPGLGEACNYLCLTDNAACIDNKCQCKLNYAPQAGKFCKPTQLHLACAFDVDCNDVEHAKCSNGECLCREKYAELDVKTCRPLEYFTTANDSCLPIDKFCNINADCSDIDNTECSDNVCKCKPNFRRLNSIVCEPLLGGACKSDAQCRIPNSACLMTKCQCTRYYVANSNNRCALLTLGQPCIDNNNCNTIPYAVCSNNICTCKQNFMAIDEDTCLPVIGGHCLEDIQCRYNTTECINDKCQCKKSFNAVSNHQCRKKNSSFSCENDYDCGEPWHSECLNSKKCFCKLNSYATNMSTCRPLLGGYCLKDDRCLPANSECSNFQCKCKNRFVAAANNLCVPVRGS
ncbi:GSCOCG00013437001-RA-CDS, partial [Cotesia congregata]